ncbi:MAG: hypothetical protein WAL75_10520 [Terracidiphilus sp.]
MSRHRQFASIILLALLATLSALGPGQTPLARNSSAAASRDQLLAAPIYWAEIHLRMFKDTVSTADFDLATSWIPGEDHKGMFRFKLFASAKRPELGAKLPGNIDYDDPEQVEKFIKRVHRCTVFLELYDSDGFLLREIPITFASGLDSSGRITELSANSAAQMDADEYRKLIGKTGATGGSFNISWVDPDETSH